MCAELPKVYTLGSIAGNVYRLMCAWWASKLHSQGTGEYAQQVRAGQPRLAGGPSASAIAHNVYYVK